MKEGLWFDKKPHTTKHTLLLFEEGYHWFGKELSLSPTAKLAQGSLEGSVGDGEMVYLLPEEVLK